MRKLRLFLAGVSLIASTFSLLAQTPSEVSGASVTNVALDTAKKSATIEVTNRSTQDIASYSLEITTRYASGLTRKSWDDEEYGPFQTAEGKALHPGQTVSVPKTFGAPANNTLVDVTAKVVAVIYADRTAEASDSDSFSRLVDMRKQPLAAYQHSAAAIQQALSSNDPHPATAAIETIKGKQVQMKISGTMDADAGFLRETKEQLQKAAGTSDERAALQQMLAEKQKKTAAYSAYADVRRVR